MKAFFLGIVIVLFLLLFVPRSLFTINEEIKGIRSSLYDIAEELRQIKELRREK